MSSSKYLPPLTPAERGAAAAADGTLPTGLLGTSADPDGAADEVRYADFLVDEDDEDDEGDDTAVDRVG